MILNGKKINGGDVHESITWSYLERGQAAPLFGRPMHKLSELD